MQTSISPARKLHTCIIKRSGCEYVYRYTCEAATAAVIAESVLLRTTPGRRVISDLLIKSSHYLINGCSRGKQAAETPDKLIRLLRLTLGARVASLSLPADVQPELLIFLRLMFFSSFLL